MQDLQKFLILHPLGSLDLFVSKTAHNLELFCVAIDAAMLA